MTYTPKTLSDKALLARINISCWNGIIQDKTITEDINSSKGIKGKRGSFSKKIMQGEKLNAVINLQQKLRKFLADNSLPWDDNGWRLIKATDFITLKQKIDDMTAEFNKAVKNFIDNYDSIKLEDLNFLGTSYNKDDYPSVGELSSKFEVRMGYDKVSDSDFRNFGYDAKIIEEMEKSQLAEFEQRLNSGKVEILNRVREEIAHFIERLNKGSFKKNTIDNIHESLANLRNLNITEDSTIDQLADLISNIMPTDAEEVRDSEQKQTEAKEVCKTSIEAIDELINDLLG